MRTLIVATLLLAACAPARSSAQPIGRRSRPGLPRKVDADRFARFNLDRINEYRARAGLTPLVLDAKLSAFALEGSRESKAGGPAHGHIAHASKDERARAGFGSSWAENQGWSSRLAADPVANEEKQIASLLDGMMKEGPGGGHHDNILSKGARRLGVGIVMADDGGITLTNDFTTE